MIVSLGEGQLLHTVLPLDGTNTHVGLLSQQGRLVLLPLDSIPFLKKGRGVKLIGLLKEDLAQKKDALHMSRLLSPEHTLQLVKLEQQWTQSPKQWLSNVCKRGHRGIQVPRNFRNFSTLETFLVAAPVPAS